MHIIPERVRSIYLCLYCGLILPPTAVLALLEYCGLCDPTRSPGCETSPCSEHSH